MSDNLKFDQIQKREHPIYIDLKLMRNAIQNMNDGKSEGVLYTLKDLLNLAIEKGIVVQDSECPSNKND